MASLFNDELLWFFIWGITSAILMFCGGLYYYRARQRDDLTQKRLIYGFACIFFFEGVSIIFFFLSYAVYFDVLELEDYIIAYNLYFILMRMAYASQLLGIIVFIYSFERIYKKTKYTFTIINLFLLCLVFIGPMAWTYDIYYIITIYVDFILIYVILLKFTIWSQAGFKALTSLFLFGFTLTTLGLGLNAYILRETNPLFYYLPPILVVMGCFLSITPTILNQTSYEKAFIYWILSGVFLIFIVIFIIIYFILMILSNNLAGIQYLINSSMLLILLVFSFSRIVKSMRVSSSKEDFQKRIDVSKMFSRPQMISQEEITFHKEQKICLVCKSKVSKTLYVCPSCDALYCLKCFNALKKQENACWICEAPLDESKPVKRVEESSLEKPIDQGKKKDLHEDNS